MGQADASDPGLRGATAGAKPGSPPAADTSSIVQDLRRLSRKMQGALMEALLPGEQPHVVIEGAGGSAIVGTAERVVVLKTGTRAGIPLAARAKAFEFESVIGVRLDDEASPAVVVVDAPVMIASCRVYWADSRDNPWKARNAMPADHPLEPVAAGVEALKGLLEAYRDRHPPAAARHAPPPPAQRPTQMMQALPGGEDRGVVAPLPIIGERCPECRAELRSGWRYCPGCGAPSGSASAPRTS